jgi:hypothetical protein
VAPLVGGGLAAVIYRYLFANEGTVADANASPAVQTDREVGPTSATP